MVGKGSIPACAGEPCAFDTAASAIRVYPRVCGGTFVLSLDSPPARGLSPRVRGNPSDGLALYLRRRSIPACAGEPGGRVRAEGAAEVYPRVCGGTLGRDASRIACTGLSPRVRGNRRARPSATPDDGSIPACAGEPLGPSTAPSLTRVYPRVCGGTHWLCVWLLPDRGLSPRVRGNRNGAGRDQSCAGSIPACAGEPLCRPQYICQ